MIGKLKDLTINRDTSQNITVTIEEDFREMFDKLKDGEVFIEIKKASKRRSMDANNYTWYLCAEIAKRSSKYSTDGKNEVYHEAIRAKGEFEPLLIKKDAVDKFLNRWTKHGLGWFADIVDEYKENYYVLHAYYGSSTYDSQSMSHIIDYLVMIADDLGIPTITGAAQLKMLEAWAKTTGETQEKNREPVEEESLY